MCSLGVGACGNNIVGAHALLWNLLASAVVCGCLQGPSICGWSVQRVCWHHIGELRSHTMNNTQTISKVLECLQPPSLSNAVSNSQPTNSAPAKDKSYFKLKY